MKLSIVGSRSFSDYALLKASILKSFPEVSIVVSGGAKGADQMGQKFAEDMNLKTEIYLPDWKRYGKGAGIVRNTLIVKNSHALIAFWDGTSRGTKKTIAISRALGKRLIIVRF